jgi:hypothetical protein
MLSKPRIGPKKNCLICPVPFLGFCKKKSWKKVCFVLRFVDILDRQENVARDDKILERN